MKNGFFYLLCFISFSGTLAAQSKLFVKLGYGSGSLIEYGGANSGRTMHEPMKYGPEIGLQYRSQAFGRLSWYGAAGLLRHKFALSETYGGLGGGVSVSGNFNFIHGYAVLGGALKIHRFFILRLGIGPMAQLYGKTDAVELGYGQFAPSSANVVIKDYFRQLFFVADPGIELPFRHFSLDLSLKQELGTHFAQKSTHSGFQPQLASWRFAILVPVWHN